MVALISNRPLPSSNPYGTMLVKFRKQKIFSMIGIQNRRFRSERNNRPDESKIVSLPTQSTNFGLAVDRIIYRARATRFESVGFCSRGRRNHRLFDRETAQVESWERRVSAGERICSRTAC